MLRDYSVRWRNHPLLHRARILVAEDQPFIALELALAIEDAGGEVVGPAASVEEALILIAALPLGAAILDVNLADGDCSAVVEVLAGLRVPMILQTGVGLPPSLANRFPELRVHIKPCATAQLITELESLIADQAASVGPAMG